jgi:hypothetical protein
MAAAVVALVLLTLMAVKAVLVEAVMLVIFPEVMLEPQTQVVAAVVLQTIQEMIPAALAARVLSFFATPAQFNILLVELLQRTTGM